MLIRRPFVLGMLLWLVTGCSVSPAQPQFETPLGIADIRIRDPFIHVDQKTNVYYMYAQMDNRLEGNDDLSNRKGVEVYRSYDLQRWSEPTSVLELAEDSWARKLVWAPEMHAFNGRYYLFVTLTSDDLHEGLSKPEGRENWPDFHRRGTQVFHADHPMGPFTPFANRPHTPESWMALDGSLWVEKGRPYMVFCHEWVQQRVGTMDVVELSPDLSRPVSEPVLLFDAKAAPWGRGVVTDGCYLYRTKSGQLLMIWSSFGRSGYAIGIAQSQSGTVYGPWTQQPEPLFAENGGHGMLFTDLAGRLLCALHQPNSPVGQERLMLFEIEDAGDTLRLRSRDGAAAHVGASSKP